MRAFAALCMIATGGCSPAPGAADDDVVVWDPDVSIKDPEFDDATARMTWQEQDGSAVWVVSLDPRTGWPFTTPLQVDRAIAPFDTVFNGPEWMHSARGSEIVYTGAHGNLTRVVRAFELAPGAWRPEIVRDGAGAIGSLQLADPSPKVVYIDEQHRSAWGWADGDGGEVFFEQKVQHRPWFVPHTSWLVFTGIDGRGGGWQIMRHHLDTGRQDTLTRCAAGCVEGNLFWSDVEADWRLGAAVLDDEGGPVGYAVFAPGADGEPFEEVRHVDVPVRDGLPYVLSPELFQFDGHTYVSFQLSRHPGFGVNPSEIWYAGLDPGSDVVRRVSDATDMVRKDPEPFVTDATVWLYYSEDIDDHRILHRCGTGLRAAGRAGRLSR